MAQRMTDRQIDLLKCEVRLEVLENQRRELTTLIAMMKKTIKYLKGLK